MNLSNRNKLSFHVQLYSYKYMYADRVVSYMYAENMNDTSVKPSILMKLGYLALMVILDIY